MIGRRRNACRFGGWWLRAAVWPEAARAAEKAKRASTQRISTAEREQRFGMLFGLALALVVAP